MVAKKVERTKHGVQLLKRAYDSNPHNPMVLNLLSDYFFNRKQHEKAQLMAAHALTSSSVPAMRAQSYHYLGRLFHQQVRVEDVL